MSERILSPLSEGPYKGMLANQRMPVPEGFSSYVQNFYLDDGVYIGRPGMTLLDTVVEDQRIQGIAFHQELDGTTHWLVFVNGDMYEFDEDDLTFTQTDLSSEGITMSSSATLDFANSRGRLIVADGVNDPWMLSGTTGAWTFTTLSSARAGAGVDIYYDKLFVWDLPDPDQNEFEWSDEGDPENGYVGSDQVWEFAQRDAGAIVAMVPLNEAMGIFKQDSSTWLSGAVDEDFQANAVREGLSETEGVVGLHAAEVLDGDIYLLSQSGPRRVSGGVWQRINESEGFNVVEDIWADVNPVAFPSSFVFMDTVRRLVVFMLPFGDTSRINKALVYAVDSDSWGVFQWDPAEFDFTCATPIEDQNGREFVLMGTEDGRVFKYGTSRNDDAGHAIERIIRSRPYGRSTPTTVKRLVEVQLMLNMPTNLTGEVRPVKEGETLEGKLFGLTREKKRYRYRRGMNVTGYDVGWELYVNRVDQTVSLESSVVFVSVVGNYPSL